MLLMLGCIALCEVYWSPLAYALTVMFIGARQIGLGTIALHDGLHGLLLRDRRHNDLMGRRSSWPHRIIASSALAGIVVGAWMSVYPCQIFLYYWLLPLATWGMFVNAVRFITEHYPPGLYGRASAASGMILTRETLPTWFDLLFVATRGINYHLTHHLFPAVPFSKLRQLQRQLAKTNAYQKVAHVTHGYHRALLEVFTKELPAQRAVVVR
jgi:fatty acid desaturase